MTIKRNNSSRASSKKLSSHSDERGIALITALMMMLLLSAITITVLAVVQSESHIAGSDLKRTQTFYCAASGIEKMTSDFSALYTRTARPTPTQLTTIADGFPTELVAEGFSFKDSLNVTTQSIVQDTAALDIMRTTQNIADPALPRVTMPNDSPFGGLIASVNPYVLTSTCTARDGTQVALTRNMNNYLIPLFQFGMFSDDDIELHPGATFTFNGRVHANGNIYVAGLVKFLDKVTSAHEVLYDTMRNGAARGSASTVTMDVGSPAVNVTLNKGSLNGGPNILLQAPGMPNYFPGSPNGTVWAPATFVWKTTSVQKPVGVGAANDNKFDGKILTRVTGAAKLELPMQLDGSPTREIIKRRLATDSLAPPAIVSALTESRYHTKAKIRILIDDEGVDDAAGLDKAQNADTANNAHAGVRLSQFDPMMLPNATVAAQGGRALWRILDNNTAVGNSYADVVNGTTYYPMQQQFQTPVQADTVRGVKPAPPVFQITDANNSNPLRITTATNHGFVDGDQVVITGVTGNANANGKWTITRVNATRFTLNGQTGVGGGGYTGGGSVYSFTAIPKSANGAAIPPGAGITGQILIQIVDANNVWRDVTREVLSMGMTVGEPNSIVQLQRPLWAAFTQGSRDSNQVSLVPNAAFRGDVAYANHLVDIVNKTHLAADGEVNTGGLILQDPGGYLTGIVDDDAASAVQRSDIFPALNIGGFTGSMWNTIVPINVYNVREGRLTTSNAAPNLTSDANQVYERGITNVVELNMKNLARWVDGVYDLNLLAGTGAVSGNIARPDGYVVYVSDRRGDKIKNFVVPVAGTSPRTFQNIVSTNGMADNIDIYGPNDRMDDGEDVQGSGILAGTLLVKDETELPDPAVLASTSNAIDFTSRRNRAMYVASWSNPNNYFRRALRLFNAEDLQTTGAPRANLSPTLGITVSSENMIYTWGNYNTTGINIAPPAGTSSLNDKAVASHYLPDTFTILCPQCDRQVPTSIVGDAWFALSRTWADSLSSIYPDNQSNRTADRLPLLPVGNVLAVADETSVRAGIIAGNNLGAIAGLPDAGNNAGASESRLNGGMHNFPRFLENWNGRFNFVGALIPLYRSTQALGPYNASSSIYDAPVRNWSFDITFTDPARLPPGTPQFQHIEPTGFRQIL